MSCNLMLLGVALWLKWALDVALQQVQPGRTSSRRFVVPGVLCRRGVNWGTSVGVGGPGISAAGQRHLCQCRAADPGPPLTGYCWGWQRPCRQPAEGC